jgi:hypothetical protein
MRSWQQKLRDGKSSPMTQYVYNVLLSWSQALSALTGGDPDESVSSRTGRAMLADKVWFKNVQGPFIDWLVGERDHCLNSIENDEKRIKELWDWAK